MRRIFAAALFLLALSAAPAFAQTLGASCPTNGVTAAPNSLGQTLKCSSGAWALAPAFAGNDTASCTSTNAGEVIWNGTVMEYCNGSAWTQFEPAQGTPVVTASSGSGYFVMSYGTYTGLSLSSADSTCLSDLTTNTGWKGYSTANANGQLIASKVHSFYCSSSACNNLMPLTTYYFANAGNSSAGGAYFTTDSNGIGPYDNNNWSAANYFSGNYTYWSDRGTSSSTQWTNSNQGNNADCGIYGWGDYGQSSYTDSNRWAISNDPEVQCPYTSYYYICYVNP